MEKELIGKNVVINFLFKDRCSNINDLNKQRNPFDTYSKEKELPKCQKERESHKVYEKAQVSQHDLKNERLVIGDSILNRTSEKGLLVETMFLHIKVNTEEK